jgi:hypothetical protein
LEPGLIIQIYNPSTWEARAEESQVQRLATEWVPSQPGLYSKTSVSKKQKEKKDKLKATTIMSIHNSGMYLQCYTRESVKMMLEVSKSHSMVDMLLSVEKQLSKERVMWDSVR